jgi:hypothetical protein
MNTHKNARLTFARRMQLVRSILDQDLDPAVAAAQQGVSAPTARKWLCGVPFIFRETRRIFRRCR